MKRKFLIFGTIVLGGLAIFLLWRGALKDEVSQDVSFEAQTPKEQPRVLQNIRNPLNVFSWDAARSENIHSFAVQSTKSSLFSGLERRFQPRTRNNTAADKATITRVRNIPKNNPVFPQLWPPQYIEYLHDMQNIMVSQGALSVGQKREFQGSADIIDFLGDFTTFLYERDIITAREHRRFLASIHIGLPRTQAGEIPALEAARQHASVQYMIGRLAALLHIQRASAQTGIIDEINVRVTVPDEVLDVLTTISSTEELLQQYPELQDVVDLNKILDENPELRQALEGIDQLQNHLENPDLASILIQKVPGISEVVAGISEVGTVDNLAGRLRSIPIAGDAFVEIAENVLRTGSIDFDVITDIIISDIPGLQGALSGNPSVNDFIELSRIFGEYPELESALGHIAGFENLARDPNLRTIIAANSEIQQILDGISGFNTDDLIRTLEGAADVRGIVEGALEDVLGSTLDGFFDDLLGDALGNFSNNFLGDIVDKILGDALDEILDDALGSILDGVVDDFVDGVINDFIDDILSDFLDDVVGDIVGDLFGGALDDILGGTLGGFLGGGLGGIGGGVLGDFLGGLGSIIPGLGGGDCYQDPQPNRLVKGVNLWAPCCNCEICDPFGNCIPLGCLNAVCPGANAIWDPPTGICGCDL